MLRAGSFQMELMKVTKAISQGRIIGEFEPLSQIPNCKHGTLQEIPDPPTCKTLLLNGHYLRIQSCLNPLQSKANSDPDFN